jgi:hypothetical protein
MTRALSALALVALLAGPAAAQEVRVNVIAKDEATVRQDVRQAVETVCKAASRDGAFNGAYTVQDCLMNGETRAMQQYKAYQRDAAAQPQATALASNAAVTERAR